MADKPRLTDAQALRKWSKAGRDLIKRKGFVRCLLHENCWHDAEPKAPKDWGNDVRPFHAPCLCRSRRGN